jgi:hypothetical protein
MLPREFSALSDAIDVPAVASDVVWSFARYGDKLPSRMLAGANKMIEARTASRRISAFILTNKSLTGLISRSVDATAAAQSHNRNTISL